ncbi:sensor histidine kinase [Thermoactinospora rubra]|uniref:sensor histidine kinase n=1 Tax=Thermoactinospora rubra TaxID=1088767 RepID=UPI000A10FEC6|nr:sensor histidine kinase [Thermoactinospora rubra]
MRNRRALLLDSVLAAMVAAASVAAFWLTDPVAAGAWQGTAGVRGPDVLGAVLVGLGCLPVAARRRWPLAALCASTVPHLVLAVLGYLWGFPGAAGLVLAYSVAGGRGLAVALLGLACALLATLATVTLWPLPVTWNGALVWVVLLLAMWAAGRAARLRRAYLRELQERAARLEAAREADTRAARAEERSRIARELHDVVAHHVSVMTVQAAAARRVLAEDPEQAREALTAIETTGRIAMREMRELVGLLRTPAERGPQPGMDALPTLVEQMREAGLPTRLEVEGDPVPLPAGVDLAAYRLIQEGLTNTLRHAGAGAQATVTVRHAPAELEVAVLDDGRGARNGEVEGGGHGLVGIRERVALYGGILSVGPRPGGGFEIQARFPLRPSGRAEGGA